MDHCALVLWHGITTMYVALQHGTSYTMLYIVVMVVPCHSAYIGTMP